MQSQKNTIIAGSTKCGTTSLFRYLADHPQMCASIIKETRFFWTNEYSLPVQKINNKECNQYDDFFLGCSEQKWRLEATPDYLYSENTAKKIKETLPDCRIIFILRHPIDRIISWFKFSKQQGNLPEHCLLDEYISMLKQHVAADSPQYLKALEQGKYAHYLQYYFNRFGNENILVTFYDDLQNNPALLMNAICNFLNIDKSYYADFDYKIFNPSLNLKNTQQFSKYISFKKKLRHYNSQLPLPIRNFFRKQLKPLDTFYLKNKTNKWEESNLSAENLNFLNTYYAHDNQLLKEIVKTKIPW